MSVGVHAFVRMSCSTVHIEKYCTVEILFRRRKFCTKLMVHQVQSNKGHQMHCTCVIHSKSLFLVMEANSEVGETFLQQILAALYGTVCYLTNAGRDPVVAALVVTLTRLWLEYYSTWKLHS